MNYPNQGIRRWLLPAIVILGAAVISVALIYPSLVADPGAEIEPTLPPELSPAATLASPSTTATPAPTLEEPASSTPTATPTSNCTYTMYYWLDNPDAWLVSNVEINGRSYTQAEAFSVLGSASNDTRTRVLQQFFAAFLNTLKGRECRGHPEHDQRCQRLDQRTSALPNAQRYRSPRRRDPGCGIGRL